MKVCSPIKGAAWGLALLSGLWLSAASAWASTPLRVLVDIKPTHALVTAIMEGLGEPELLFQGPQLPWQWTADDALEGRLEKADVVIWTGPELTPGLTDAMARLPAKVRRLELLGDLPMKVLPLRDGSDRRDPFFWLDGRNMLILLDELTQLMGELDPANAPAYERNRARMAEQISVMDRKMEYGYRSISGTALYLYHDSQQYFEQAFAMKVAAMVAGPPMNPVASASGLLEVSRQLKDGPPSCLLVDVGFDSAHLDLLLDQGEVTAVMLDTLGVRLEAGANLYLELMKANYQAIAACVRKVRGEPESPPDSAYPDPRRFPPVINPRYLLRDQYGNPVSDRDFPGQFQLINFGYTFCPDICPTSLAIMAQTMHALGSDSERVQPIFITVDPERDTPEVLKRYAAFFHPRMLGLSGAVENTRRIAELFHVRYLKVAAESGDPQAYSMDHTASLYLLGPDGRFIAKFPHGQPGNELAQRIREWMD